MGPIQAVVAMPLNVRTLVRRTDKFSGERSESAATSARRAAGGSPLERQVIQTVFDGPMIPKQTERWYVQNVWRALHGVAPTYSWFVQDRAPN